MSLHQQLLQRAAQGQPVRVALIGAGKFGSMYLAQVPRTPGVHLVAIADLNPEAARANLRRVGWSPERAQARNVQEAIANNTTWVTDDWRAVATLAQADIVVESTGSPVHAVDHILAALDHGKHVVNVTVEADALCGPMLAQHAAQRGLIYSLAYGDQPAMICELVDWARTCGFPVVAAGRGHKWMPHFCESTPETVWGYYGLSPEQATRGGLNPKMFNSFLDGSKPAIESTAVANATGLAVPSDGLSYPSASVADIPVVMRPRSEGGVLERKGMVEVISSLDAQGQPIAYDIRMGVWVTVEAVDEYVKNCFEEYNAHTDPSGRYFTLYKRWHLIGLEVGMSIASVALRREATGVAQAWNADVVATAKRDLKAGEMLDGEGGYTVWGKLLPAERALALNGLPLGLAHKVKLLRPVAKGQPVRWDDVVHDTSTRAYELRLAMQNRARDKLLPTAQAAQTVTANPSALASHAAPTNKATAPA